MGGRPEYAVADGKGMIYDNIEDKDEVVVLGLPHEHCQAHWPIAPSGGATPWKWTSNIAASSSAGATRCLPLWMLTAEGSPDVSHR